MKRINLPFRPFREQAEVILGAQRCAITAAVAGARGGKTEVGRWILADWAIQQPGYLDEDLDRNQPYSIAVWAPTYPMLSKIVLPAVLRAIPEQLQIEYRKSDRELFVRGLKGITLIHFLSGHEPERSRGLQLYRGWIDEAALVSEAMFEEAQTRLADRHGALLLTSTPCGPNWLKKRVADMAHKEPEKICFISWRTVDNPYFPRDELEFKRRTMNPRYFKRTYEASFEAFEGMVFEEWNNRKHVFRHNAVAIHIRAVDRWIGNRETAERRFVVERVIAGVDWGQVNPTAVVVIGVTKNDEYILLDEQYDIGILPYGDGNTWAKRAEGLQKKWGIRQFWCDPNRPDIVKAWKQKHHLPAAAARDDVIAGLQIMMNYIHIADETGEPRFFVYHAPMFVDEVHTYQWARTATSTPKEHPQKTNDHAIDAVRYAVYTDVANRFHREPNFRFKLPHDIQVRLRYGASFAGMK